MNRSPYLSQKSKPYSNQQKQRTCIIVDFTVPADHWINLKGYEKKDKYLELAGELEKTYGTRRWQLYVIGAFGTVTKGLLKGQVYLEFGGRVETIQTTALFGTARIQKRVLETWGDLLSLKLQWKNHQLTLMWKNSQGVNNNNNNNNNNSHTRR